MTTFYSNGFDSKPNNVFYRTGKEVRVVNSKITVDVSEIANGDIFVLAPNLTSNSRIHRIMTPAGTPAVTSAADNDLGFYYQDRDGNLVAIDADVLVDGLDLTSAFANIDLLSENASLNRVQTIGELLGLEADDTYADGIFLCMTMNTAATGSDVALDFDIHVECPTAN